LQRVKPSLVTFDPKEGARLNIAEMDDPEGVYVCTARYNNLVRGIEYTLRYPTSKVLKGKPNPNSHTSSYLEIEINLRTLYLFTQKSQKRLRLSLRNVILNVGIMLTAKLLEVNQPVFAIAYSKEIQRCLVITVVTLIQIAPKIRFASEI